MSLRAVVTRGDAPWKQPEHVTTKIAETAGRKENRRAIFQSRMLKLNVYVMVLAFTGEALDAAVTFDRRQMRAHARRALSLLLSLSLVYQVGYVLVGSSPQNEQNTIPLTIYT